jgi:acyl-CoA synthetase (NDP forming)
MFEEKLTRALEEQGYLFFEDCNRAVAAVGALARFSEVFKTPLPRPPAIPGVPGELTVLPSHAVSEVEAKRILSAAGIPAVEETLVTSAGEAVAAAAKLDAPAVLKIVSPDLQHKSEIGGVLLGLEGAAAVREGFDTLMERGRAADPEARLEGVLVAPLVTGGVETILGVQRDLVFGPVIMFGLGGVYVEVMQDVTLRLAPFGEAEALEMIRRVKGYPLLEGVRGRPPCDVPALARALSKLSIFAAAHGDALESLDINPFIVLPEGQGALAVDALIVPREG